jgi:ribosomal-protein-alanine N-acetyltransferase
MPLTLSEHLNQAQLFTTERLGLKRWRISSDKADFDALGIRAALSILSPTVTNSLPDGWQNVNTPEKASNWIKERESDSDFYAIHKNDTKELIGFLFLYREAESADLRLGYLIGEKHWGKGLGTELIKGLVFWCRTSQVIKTLSGGVEEDNIASIKVLEKCGFQKATDEMPQGVILFQISF